MNPVTEQKLQMSFLVASARCLQLILPPAVLMVEMPVKVEPHMPGSLNDSDVLCQPMLAFSMSYN